MSYDPEIPAGYQDADIEMAEMAEVARDADASRKRGECPHWSRQGYNANNIMADHGFVHGEEICTDCGAVRTFEKWWEGGRPTTDGHGESWDDRNTRGYRG